MYITSLLKRIPEKEVLSTIQDIAYDTIGFGFEDTIRRVSPMISTTTSSILDVGCAGGDFVNSLSLSFPTKKVIGIDPSVTMIARAKEKYPHLKKSFYKNYLSDFLNTSQGKKVNFIICESVLHHIDDIEESFFGVLAKLQNTKADFHYFIKDLKRPYDEQVLQSMIETFPDKLGTDVKKMYEDSLRAAYTADEVINMMHGVDLKGNVSYDDKYLYITN